MAVLQKYRQDLNGLEWTRRRVGDLHLHSSIRGNEPYDQGCSTDVTLHDFNAVYELRCHDVRATTHIEMSEIQNDSYVADNIFPTHYNPRL